MPALDPPLCTLQTFENRRTFDIFEFSNMDNVSNGWRYQARNSTSRMSVNVNENVTMISHNAYTGVRATSATRSARRRLKEE